MKKGILLIISVFLTTFAISQIVVFHENFELPSLDDSVTSTETTPGIKDWNICLNLHASGLRSDTCQVKTGQTTFLTTDTFSTWGNTYVLLAFNHICKVDFLDLATVEVSNDNGASWNQLLAAHYLGSANFASNGNRFAANSYNNAWLPAVPQAVPDNSWWKTELFDISAFAADTNNIRVRFKLSDGGTPGPNNNYGWIIDDIVITAALSELTPPEITNFTPVLTGNIFNTGPFTISASVTDPSGLDTVILAYVFNGVHDTLTCVNTSGNTWKATIPQAAHLDHICYKMIAVDASLSHNTAYEPNVGSYCFTASTQEAALLSMPVPNTACGLGLETVTINIKNTGYDLIDGNFDAVYYIVGDIDTITEAVTQQIPVNATIAFSFAQKVDLTASGNDSTFQIKAILYLAGDPIPTNDAITKTLISGFVPPDPGVTHVTIPYGTSTTLTAVSPAPTVFWYSDSLGNNLLSTGHNYTTPILFDSVVYYTQAQSGMLSCKSGIVPDSVRVGNVPSQDGALTEIITPVTSVYMTQNEIVKVMVKSFGTQEITNFPIYYQINNNTPVMETFTDTLQQDDSATYTFATKVNLSVLGPYVVKAWVAITGDQTSLNDSTIVLIHHVAPNYCPSYAINGTTGSDIGNVTFNNLNNGIGTPVLNNTTAVNGYSDFTSMNSVQLAIGLAYPISISKINRANSNNQAVIKVFMDLNRNGLWEESTELVFQGQTNYFTYSVSGNITVPTSVNPGLTLMRVVLQETTNAGIVHACGAYGFGETEDYNVVLYPQIPFDAGVVQINTPLSIEPEASSVPIEVVVKNYGLDTLTSFDVVYEHNNGTPVVTPWTGVLLPAATTIITLPNLIVVGGDNNICAYTVTIDDSNPGNDFNCKYFYGDPLQNARAVSLLEPSATGCDVGFEPVEIRIKNVGLDTINGGLNAHYQRLGSPTVVTEPVTAVIAPGQFYNYTFNTLIDLTAYTNDTIFHIVGYTTLVGDFEKGNDTVYTSVETFYSPPDAITSSVTIPYATAATLTAISNDSIVWFDSPTSQVAIAGGPTYVTPILFGQEIYWVEAQIGGGATTVVLGPGNQQQRYIPAYGYYDYGWTACIYLATELNTKGDIDAIAYHFNTNQSPFPMSNQKVYLGHTTAASFTSANKLNPATMTQVYNDNVTWSGSGWFDIIFSSKFNYNGIDNLVIYWENHHGNYTSGYPYYAYTQQNANRAKYKYQDNSFPVTSGTMTLNRPDVRFIGSGGGCPSNRLADTVFITNPPPYDGAVLKLVTPVTGISMSATEDVSIKVKNYGTNSISNFAVSYQVNGGTIYTDSILTPLITQDTLIYIFNQTLNMLNFGTYNFKCWISVQGDLTGINDTIYAAVKSKVPPYCPSYATTPSSYEDIGNVTISNIDNGNASPTTGNATAINGYTDFTNLPHGQLAPGVAYPISVSAITQSTSVGNCDVKVYIDFNRNGIFDIATERVFIAVTSSSQPTVSGTVNVPFNALSGTTVMRVVLDRYGSAPPCGTYSYGETEDYVVMVAPLIPNDAGVVKFLQPGKLGNEDDIVPIEVQIRNYGTNTLNSINIEYTVNNGPPVLYTYVGTLAPTATATVMLPFHTLVRGNNYICAYTVVSGDSNSFNDMVCHGIYGQFTAILPYLNNFDQNVTEFWPDSVPNIWERGIPGGNVISAAHSIPYAWGTELSGEYDQSGIFYLYTPLISHIITGIDTLKFWHNLNTQNLDGGSIQYKSILGWKILGTQNDPLSINWYNSPMSIWTVDAGGPQWQFSAYDLNAISDFAEPTQFRFLFMAIQQNPGGYEGWALDDFEIMLPRIPRDAGIVDITAPVSPTVIGTNIDVTVEIQNFGTDTLNTVPVKYSINGATVGSEIWTGTLFPDSTVLHTFQPYPSPLVDFILCSFTDLAGDIHSYNNKYCDTLEVIAPEFDAGVIQIVSPQSPTIHGGDSAVVTALVVNFGRTAISSMDMQYTVAGNIKSTETWVGTTPLLPGDTLSYTFDTAYQHDFIGYYYLCVKTILVNDGYVYNDEICDIFEELWTEITESDIEGYSLGNSIPNPAADYAQIPFTIPSSGEIDLTIVNHLGQPVYQETMKPAAGASHFEVDVRDYASGIYFYYTEYKGRRLARKLIVQ